MQRLFIHRPVPYPWVVVTLCVVITTALSIPSQGMGALFPFIQEDLNTTRVQLGLIAAGMYVGGGVSVLLLGWLVDVMGVRRVQTAVLVWMTASIFLFSMIQSVVQGILLSALIGAALVASPPAFTRAIIDWVPRRARAAALGATESAIAVGGIVAAVLLTFMAVTFGWRTGVMVVAIIVAVLGVVFFALYRDKPGPPANGVKNIKSSGKLAEVATNRTLWMVAFAGITFGGAQNVLVSYLVLFFREDLHMSAGGAGGLLAVAMAGGAVGRLCWGMVSELLLRGRHLGLLASVSTVAVVTLAFLALLPSDTPLVLVSVLVFIVGASTVGRSGLMVVIIAELAGPGLTGTAMGFFSTIGIFGGVGFIPLFGFLVDHTGSYAIAWWMTAAQTGAGALLLVFLAMRKTAGIARPHTPRLGS